MYFKFFKSAIAYFYSLSIHSGTYMWTKYSSTVHTKPSYIFRTLKLLSFGVFLSSPNPLGDSNTHCSPGMIPLADRVGGGWWGETQQQCSLILRVDQLRAFLPWGFKGKKCHRKKQKLFVEASNMAFRFVFQRLKLNQIHS